MGLCTSGSTTVTDEPLQQKLIPKEGSAVAAPPSVLSGHIGALDGIRGLGVLLVLLHHYSASSRAFGFDNPILKLSEIGWSGVDLFFVLSGFLITGILYDSKGKEKYFVNFYARRTLRIFPLYYLAAILVITLDAFWRYDMLADQNPLWILMYVGNFQMALKGGGGILDHFWSLAIEEQFYLVWPMIVLALTRKQIMLLAVALIVIAPIIRVLLVANGVPALSIYVLTPARMDGLALGALIALAVRGPGGLAALVPWAWRLGGLASIGFVTLVLVRSTFSHADPLMLTVGISMLLTINGCLLILAITFQPLRVVMETPIMRWLGRYSYGLYVWHPIVNVTLLHSPLTERFGELNSFQSILLIGSAFGLSVLAAVLSYKFYETPFLRLKKHFH